MPTDLVRQVKDALTNLYDPSHLQTHPLHEILTLPRATGKTSGETLREALWQAIETLRPDDSLPLERAEWLKYRLLWLYYLQAQGREATCQELGLSERSFHRHLREALEATASILWQKHGQQSVSQVGTRGAAAPPHVDPAAEATRLVSKSTCCLVDWGALIAEVQETISALLEELGVDLQVEIPASLPPVCGDPTVLRQVVLNVLTETLQCTASLAARLVVREGHGRMVCQLSAADQLSAPARNMQHATGFVVSRTLLRACGGRLWFPRGRRGFVICFSVPTDSAKSILVIDDDEETTSLYRRYLQRLGCFIQEAHNREELTAQLAQVTPNLILLDVMMPRDDGWKLLQHLRTTPRTAQVPIVICSVLNQPRLALTLGAAEVLQKPISEEVLLQTVHALLNPQDS